MDTAVKTRRLEQHQGERPNALGRLTGEPPATPSQGSLLAAAAELVAALEAFDVGGDRSGEVGRKDESLNSGRQVVTGAFQKPRARGPESAAAGRKASGTVPGLTGNEWAAEALEVGQHPRTSTDLTPSPAWRDFFAQFRTPHAPYLVITAKDQACLYDFFKGTFAGVETVEVRMDRRSGDRRPADRRSRPEIDAELRASGFAFVRSQARPDVGRADSSRGEQGHPPTLGRAPSAVEPPRLSPFRRASS